MNDRMNLNNEPEGAEAKKKDCSKCLAGHCLTDEAKREVCEACKGGADVKVEIERVKVDRASVIKALTGECEGDVLDDFSKEILIHIAGAAVTRLPRCLVEKVLGDRYSFSILNFYTMAVVVAMAKTSTDEVLAIINEWARSSLESQKE